MLSSPTRPAISIPSGLSTDAVAVLASGGVTSAVILAQALDHFRAVYPVYGRFGLPWEDAEEQYLRRLLAAIRGPRLGRLKVLDLPLSDVYTEEGTIAARLVPEGDEPEQSLRISGRNMLLMSKAAVWSAVNGIEALAAGPLPAHHASAGDDGLAGQIEAVVKLGLGQSLTLLRPFDGLSGSEIISLAPDLPYEFTFSCIRPARAEGAAALHCGRCHKCAQRQESFLRAGIADRTRYADAREAVAALSSWK